MQSIRADLPDAGYFWDGGHGEMLEKGADSEVAVFMPFILIRGMRSIIAALDERMRWPGGS
ncbi:hypothetical protein BSIN_0403 [Burkholderia singularis]|uniref:Uncharacterized protein n=2 Tax=Burkholderia singularis TaxID=1503053 RepID=A0A238H6R9_9BURK|nr:hypothetical protein BSIN_0403 [Burkholderia singularis]